MQKITKTASKTTGANNKKNKTKKPKKKPVKGARDASAPTIRTADKSSPENLIDPKTQPSPKDDKHNGGAAPPATSNGADAPTKNEQEVPPAETQVKLTKRTPGELIAMKFDPNDLIFDNGMLVIGQLLAWLGQGGIGKSRLLLQLIVCLITGLEFLGWKPSKRRLKCLIIQTENNNRRLQSDLLRIRAWLGEELWRLVDQYLVIHTCESRYDGYLNVKDRTIADRIAALIMEVRAGLVAFDPLAAFATGDLNGDGPMSTTCRKLIELARLGDPHATVVLVHHTLTGKQGAAKATGVDSASFGRNSKVLHAMARAQINIAPSNDASKLVVGCGKNNDGEKFAPFGIKLNTETMIYELDPEFDLDAWQEEMGIAVHHKFTPADVAALVKDRPLSRQDLMRAIKDEAGLKQAAAYYKVKAAIGKTIRLNGNNECEAMPAAD